MLITSDLIRSAEISVNFSIKNADRYKKNIFLYNATQGIWGIFLFLCVNGEVSKKKHQYESLKFDRETTGLQAQRSNHSAMVASDKSVRIEIDKLNLF